MAISNIPPSVDTNTLSVAAQLTVTQKSESNVQDTPKQEEKQTTSKIDGFSKSDLGSSGVYSKPSQEKVQEYIRSQSNRQLVMMQNMVKEMITSQGSTFQAPDFSFINKQNLNVDKSESATNSENTDYSVDKVATKIMDFAQSLIKADPSKLEEVKKGFVNGFKAAEKVYGGEGKLPAISYATYDEVMKRFDELAINGDTDKKTK